MAHDWSALLAALPPPTEPAHATLAARSAAIDNCRRPATVFHTAVVGAGINGAAVAAALAERGQRVVLLDRGDVAGETSMASGNAVWGGFKYLANGDVGLVATSCAQRRDLVRRAPHLVRLVRYLMPCYRDDPYGLASRALGSWLYYGLGGGPAGTPAPRVYAGPGAVLRRDPRLRPEGLIGGIGYYEAELTTSDAHFTLQFVLHALLHGAAVITYAEAQDLRVSETGVELACRDRLAGETFPVRAQRLVNAAGPWAEALRSRGRLAETEHGLVLRRGTFLVTHPDALLPAGCDAAPSHFLTYFCRGEDRPFFLYPWGPRFLIGTTDVLHDPQRLDAIEPAPEEIAFMLEQVDARLAPRRRLGAQDVVETRVGVRPLGVHRERAAAASSRDALALSRRHQVDESEDGRVFTIYGGKLTPCRALAAEVADAITGPRAAPLRQIYGTHEGWDLDRMRAVVRQSAEGLELPDDDLSSAVAQFGLYASQVVRVLREAPALVERPYPDLPYTWADLVHNVRNRFVANLDDLLRRRTNIAQWVPRGGFGTAGEHAESVRQIARLVAVSTGGDPEQQLCEYRELVDRRNAWRQLLPAARR